MCAGGGNRADTSVHYKLSRVNEQLEQLERQVEYLEHAISCAIDPSAQQQQ